VSQDESEYCDIRQVEADRVRLSDKFLRDDKSVCVQERQTAHKDRFVHMEHGLIPHVIEHTLSQVNDTRVFQEARKPGLEPLGRPKVLAQYVREPKPFVQNTTHVEESGNPLPR
jgi:hypothetical protein